MNKVKVKVTQEDIDKGCKRDYLSCPIANAINRTVKGYRAEVTEVDIVLVKSTKAYYATTAKVSRRVFDFMQSFDLGLNVKPFTFTMTYE